ncbi:MAG: hypothetical protein ABSB77_14605 [Xanthobacteraceae bacterium]|jgi:hypothetical protein
MKRQLSLTGIFVAALHGAAFAQGPIPDPRAPSNFVVTPAPGGGSNALGYDSQKWNYWQTQTDPRGNMYGYDAHGNYWTYERRTNSYRYYGTEPRWQARCYSNFFDFC